MNYESLAAGFFKRGAPVFGPAAKAFSTPARQLLASSLRLIRNRLKTAPPGSAGFDMGDLRDIIGTTTGYLRGDHRALGDMPRFGLPKVPLTANDMSLGTSYDRMTPETFKGPWKFLDSTLEKHRKMTPSTGPFVGWSTPPATPPVIMPTAPVTPGLDKARLGYLARLLGGGAAGTATGLGIMRWLTNKSDTSAVPNVPDPAPTPAAGTLSVSSGQPVNWQLPAALTAGALGLGGLAYWANNRRKEQKKTQI